MMQGNRTMALLTLSLAIGLFVSGFTACKQQSAQSQNKAGSASDYIFNNGYPAPATAEYAYDEADLNRAIEAYRFFYPTVSGAAIFKGNAKLGLVPNKVFGTLEAQPKHIGFTL